ncbi:uncharacterized protein BDW43DRAFT_66885 [Aspergillus alliaceus]|uniref:uncharacterized protein n=1 Tax=Petromyces alliaceus TaxID=209559 RepID=UPI0012A73BA4|nr:uncharacterized protein BDW43DRAFT_66885 [Aspergillus alliaceus]KAB8234042.1 hypothetical protein BDW43DRAFT_66885 [Aspergillus alliaceus]
MCITIISLNIFTRNCRIPTSSFPHSCFKMENTGRWVAKAKVLTAALQSLYPARVHVETATSVFIGISVIATVIQTYALSLQRGEHRQAAICDADHLSAIQAAVMQYIGLYLGLVAAKKRGLRFMANQPVLVWSGVTLLFPFIALVIYPSYNYLTPFFLFFGGLGANLVSVHLLQMKPERRLA